MIWLSPVHGTARVLRQLERNPLGRLGSTSSPNMVAVPHEDSTQRVVLISSGNDGRSVTWFSSAKDIGGGRERPRPQGVLTPSRTSSTPSRRT